jgi:hypothetical protein
MRAGCEANVQQLVGTYCGNRMPDPLPTGVAESVRRGLESQRSCPAEVLTPLEQCVADLEARALKADPEAKQRRAAAAPKAEETKKDPQFKAMIDEWLRVFDGMKITCRNRDVSDSHARECERWQKDLDGVEEKLAKFLDARGFDRRDVSELGLWPSDPNPMGG